MTHSLLEVRGKRENMTLVIARQKEMKRLLFRHLIKHKLQKELKTLPPSSTPTSLGDDLDDFCAIDHMPPAVVDDDDEEMFTAPVSFHTRDREGEKRNISEDVKREEFVMFLDNRSPGVMTLMTMNQKQIKQSIRQTTTIKIRRDKIIL